MQQREDKGNSKGGQFKADTSGKTPPEHTPVTTVPVTEPASTDAADIVNGVYDVYTRVNDRDPRDSADWCADCQEKHTAWDRDTCIRCGRNRVIDVERKERLADLGMQYSRISESFGDDTVDKALDAILGARHRQDTAMIVRVLEYLGVEPVDAMETAGLLKDEPLEPRF